MPFHNITELPSGFCEPKTVFDEELSISDRLQITELLHGEMIGKAVMEIV